MANPDGRCAVIPGLAKEARRMLRHTARCSVCCWDFGLVADLQTIAVPVPPALGVGDSSLGYAPLAVGLSGRQKPQLETLECAARGIAKDGNNRRWLSRRIPG
jgi:hypothetical protein